MARDNSLDPVEEGRPINRSPLIAAFHAVTTAMNSIGTIWIFALVFLISADVFGRKLFNSPLQGVPELVPLLIVGIVYLALANTLRVNRFIRSDMLINKLQEKSPRFGYLLQALHHLFGAGLSFAILYFTFPKMIEAFRIDEYVGSMGDFTAPVWPIKLIIVIGSAALVLQFLLHAVNDVKVALGLAEPPPPPAADTPS